MRIDSIKNFARAKSIRRWKTSIENITISFHITRVSETESSDREEMFVEFLDSSNANYFIDELNFFAFEEFSRFCALLLISTDFHEFSPSSAFVAL